MSETPPASANPLLIAAGIALLAGFLALGWIGSSLGIGSLDANGIIYVTNLRATTGAIEESRPPGHPLSEYWILPTVARVASSHGISAFGYGLYQLVGALGCLALFWLLLGELAVTPARRLLALACLAFSPQFLITASDGEEFVWSMAFVFAAVLIITKLHRDALRPPEVWWCIAVLAGVAASGYRIEFGAMALFMVFGTLFFSNETWPYRIALGALALIFLLVVWSPVLLHHVAPPYPNPLSLKTRLAIGGYKIAFHSLGIVPFVIGLVALFQSRNGCFKSFLAAWAFAFVYFFLALFFIYPTKILEVLPGIAFLILLAAAYAGPLTWTAFVAACMSLCLVHVDCFADRKFTGLSLQPSLWAQNLADKPAVLLPQVEAASGLATTGSHVIITRLWPWSLAWQTNHAAWPAVPDSRADYAGTHEAYRFGPGIIASRDILSHHTDVLKTYLQQGDDIWIDESLYREMYMRYDLNATTPETTTVEGLPARVVEIR